jgi:type I restriction enzyme S subunit
MKSDIEQQRIVTYLNSFSLIRDPRQTRLASLRELQSETQEELDALLPSVLDRAFKGEL